MQIRCPICDTLTTWKENPYRPFCSERCKLIDLGRWAMEAYKVAEPIGPKSDIQQVDEEMTGQKLEDRR